MRFFETTSVEVRVKEFEDVTLALEALQAQYFIVENTVEVVEHNGYWSVSVETGTEVRDIEWVFEEADENRYLKKREHSE